MKNIFRKIDRRIKDIQVCRMTCKYVFMSDMHLGQMDNADETVYTSHLIEYALQHYYDLGYRVVMLGDTFELAETHDIDRIKDAHSPVMDLLKKLYERGDLIIVKGNHDAFMTSEDLEYRRDMNTGNTIMFLDGIQMPDAVRIGHVLALHGHQDRWMYSSWFNRILISLGSVWSKWQKHHSDFHSQESTGWQERDKFDKTWQRYGREKGLHIIAGHSHKCVYGTENYTNIGTAGVMKRCITCAELDNDCIASIAFRETVNPDGHVIVKKEIMSIDGIEKKK